MKNQILLRTRLELPATMRVAKLKILNLMITKMFFWYIFAENWYIEFVYLLWNLILGYINRYMASINFFSISR